MFTPTPSLLPPRLLIHHPKPSPLPPLTPKFPQQHHPSSLNVNITAFHSEENHSILNVHPHLHPHHPYPPTYAASHPKPSPVPSLTPKSPQGHHPSSPNVNITGHSEENHSILNVHNHLHPTTPTHLLMPHPTPNPAQFHP